jgi:hypothetical protein
MNVERLGEDFEFVLRRREKDLLLHILGLYPRTPAGHHRLTGTSKSAELDGTRRLLDESLESGRKETREKLESWLSVKGRFTPAEKGFKLKILAGEIEWLLQVLNEIRVGSWIRLGAPHDELDTTRINPAKAADFGIMSMAGFFEIHLLEAIRGEA